MMQDTGLALVSIHDVMPHTLDKVKRLVDIIGDHGDGVVSLLVVPGCDWREQELHWLRQLPRERFALVGHGWRHRCDTPATTWHRLHSLLLSRNVAEHLSLNGAAIATLISDCYQWMRLMALAPAPLYVPPAWAMGNISALQLQALPFRYYETLAGVYDAATDSFHRLPLIGYEADSLGRALALRAFNFCNRWRATSMPVRLAIHPDDLQLYLAADLLRDLTRVQRFADYSVLARPASLVAA